MEIHLGADPLSVGIIPSPLSSGKAVILEETALVLINCYMTHTYTHSCMTLLLPCMSNFISSLVIQLL